MKFIQELLLHEAKAQSGDYPLFHPTYTSAIQTALEIARSRGYEYDKDEVFSIIGSGPKKPQEGDTNKFSVPLMKDGREVKEALQIQVYNRGGEKPYELNTYIW